MEERKQEETEDKLIIEESKASRDFLLNLFELRKCYGRDLRAVILIKEDKIHLIASELNKYHLSGDVDDEVPEKPVVQKESLTANNRPNYFG